MQYDDPFEFSESFNDFMSNTILSEKFYTLIYSELLDELKQGLLHDGILLADLNLCKRRLIREDDNKENSGCIRITEEGIYFEKNKGLIKLG